MATFKSTKFETDIVIIGAGPATLGLLSNAVKSNKLQELVAGGQGLAIIEAGLSFGGGSLQNFSINSNTSANGFIKCLYKKKDAPVKVEQTPDKKLKNVKAGLEEMSSDDEGQKANTAEYIATQPFKDLYKQSPIIQMAFEFGPSCIPLSAVGMIMNFAGNHLLHHIYSVWKKKIFYPMTRVTSISLNTNGEILINAIRTECQINLLDGGGGGGTGRFEIIKQGETQLLFKTKAVVFSQGGKQTLHQEFYNWFPSMMNKRDRVITSDYFLNRQNAQQIFQKIKKERIRKIVIIGGAHSGFSSAWLLLNGPADVLHNTHVKPSVKYRVEEGKPFKFPDAVYKTQAECQNCCNCSKKPKCTCVCKCFGFFKYEHFNFNYENLPDFQEADIKILYRDKIKVFFCKVQQAEQLNYNEYKANLFTNKNGYLYSFTGLRGDAKKLYMQIKEGQEKRVKLVKCPTVADQDKYVSQADLVIWATGYQTSDLPIRDHDQKPVQLLQKQLFTQYDVDSKCRLITADNSVLAKCFGSGIAFPMRTNDGMTNTDYQKPNPRADSFSLYMGFVANTMLSNLLPKHKIDSKQQKILRPEVKKDLTKAQMSSAQFKTPEKSSTIKVAQIMEHQRAMSQGNAYRATQLRQAKKNQQQEKQTISNKPELLRQEIQFQNRKASNNGQSSYSTKRKRDALLSSGQKQILGNSDVTNHIIQDKLLKPGPKTSQIKDLQQDAKILPVKVFQIPFHKQISNQSYQSHLNTTHATTNQFLTPVKTSKYNVKSPAKTVNVSKSPAPLKLQKLN